MDLTICTLALNIYVVFTPRNAHDRLGTLFSGQVDATAKAIAEVRKISRPHGALRMSRPHYILTFRTTKERAPELKKELRKAAEAAKVKLARSGVVLAYRVPKTRPP